MQVATRIIAERLGESYDRTRYAIAKLGLKPAGRVGNYNLYAEDDIPKIQAALRGIRRLSPAIPSTTEVR